MPSHKKIEKANRYSDRLRLQRSELTFVYKRSPMDDEDTVESLDIKEGDIIKVFLKSQLIDLKVANLDGAVTHVRIQGKTKLKKLMDIYCERCNIPRSKARFLYRGSRILDEDTLDSLNIKDGDIINCHPAQKR